MVDELQPFKTSNTSLAAYLHMRGMVVLTTRTDPNDSKREIFVFLDQDERPDFEFDFLEGEANIFFKYYKSLRVMNGLIAEARRQQYGQK